MSDHDDHDGGLSAGRSYLGLISLIVVILIFIVALVYLGVGPLQQESERATEGGATREAAGLPSAPGNAVAALPAPDAVLSRIAFGSGLDENGPMDIFNTISAGAPQLFIFAGDNVFVDEVNEKAVGEASNIVTSPLMIRTAYATLGSRSEFQAFRAKIPVIATWDDHDFGLTGAGENFAYKQASKEAFFDFFGVPRDSERFAQPDGIYAAYAFGPEGKRVQVILLDTRWNRSPAEVDLSVAPTGPAPDRDPTKTLLGDAQWKWLEQQLIEPADVRLIVSSIQVIAEEQDTDCWANLPRERDRLMKVLSDTDAQNVVLLSGDRGEAVIYKNDNALSYSLYDVTSSSLNRPPPARPTATSFADAERVDAPYGQANYGIVDIDWAARAINLELHDKTGGLIRGIAVPMTAQEPVNQ